MAYILGFFAADGYITINKRGGQFWCVDVIDKKIIEQIKKQIEADHKISLRKKQKDKYLSYRLQIGSIEMCNDLRFLGFNEKKTKNLSIPNIPDKYFCHFVRGYFDGDGHVWFGWTHKDRKTKTLVIHVVFTSCSRIFLESIRNRLERFGIMKGRINKGGGNYHRLVYSILNSLKLYDFMYNNLGLSKLFLYRKKVIFERYIKMRL